MDAPALPPSSEIQPVAVENVNAADRADRHAIAPQTSLEKLPAAFGWLSSGQLTRSFNFVGQAFKTAQLGNLFGQLQYSSVIPIQWARSNDWKRWAAAADIQVELIDVSAEHLQFENEVWSSRYGKQCLPNADRVPTSGSRYRISLKDKTLGYVADEAKAYRLAQRLRRLTKHSFFEAGTIAPHPVEFNDAADFVVSAAGQPLFPIDDSMAEAIGYSKEWAAVAWANNLRLAIDAEPLSLGRAQATLQNLVDSDLTLNGEASWYGPYFHGRATANGETYDQTDLTVAHKSLPFGTHLKVRNTLNNQTVVVRVNDRGPYAGDRTLDLSKAAAQCLGSDQIGVIPYEAVILKSATR
ncbi:MAG: septal ring lytic transglycosylase RlpA family protein [Phormidesmis sp.]